MAEHYPRDLIGYGATPPDPRWPDGARLALQIVLNYEEGGERCVLDGDGAVGWYTGRNSPNTRRLVVEHGGFLYDADSYSDDLPYWEHVSGKQQWTISSSRS